MMDWLILHKEILDLITGIITAIGAGVFGAWQILINKRLVEIQDFVSVAVTPFNDKIKVINLGKIDLYLKAFKVGGRINKLDKGAFLSSAAPESAFYWIPINADFPKDGKFEMEFYLHDRFGKKYITDVSCCAFILPENQSQFIFTTHETRIINKYEI